VGGWWVVGGLDRERARVGPPPIRSVIGSLARPLGANAIGLATHYFSLGSPQTRMPRSSPAESACRPSGLKATTQIDCVCPLKFWSSLPVARSHKRTVRSKLADSARLPSGGRATLQTCCVCPSNLWTSLPVAMSQRRTVLSQLPESRRRPSRVTARLATPSVWPLN